MKSGKKTINAGALKPHELVEEAMQFTARCASENHLTRRQRHVAAAPLICAVSPCSACDRPCMLACMYAGTR